MIAAAIKNAAHIHNNIFMAVQCEELMIKADIFTLNSKSSKRYSKMDVHLALTNGDSIIKLP
jgi:hypothetical protein